MAVSGFEVRIWGSSLPCNKARLRPSILYSHFFLFIAA